ncbi:uncharacterized protein J4E78_002353 [Alternaria triticimaculans]|uniref:uncharacterized protein n=1 Tax=Alternaria triticimaculans TaxID=297637 RepID=UPI0020C2B23D|nr:uncharacterized protein J4E78_002353 [Alternaria triticimaculans]KAI4668526.1 hypothetical protein J4E78_002353 [Alternaria triticimaculans]
MSGKRSRALTDGLDPNGSGSNSRNKRPRQSESEGSDQSSDDERSNAASGSDSSDDEGEHMREREIRATQQVQKEHRATADRENVATDSGIIEEIQCINFMCHEHLTVTLGPLINFIIGHNGSGKSAVLTALTICLGGKATATNRAQNLKSLIKEGKDHASVTVKIKNQGPLAYKPAQYGDSIIVERHFSRSGTSGFKLKNVNNKLVTNKKAELEDILDAFSMQIDNPMNVLTQDMARQFLNHSTPKDKYKFFLQGTQLENLNRDYQQIEQSLEVMNTKAEVKEADLTTLRREMEALEKKARKAASLQTMRDKETEFARQAAWATVREHEDDVAHNENGLADTERIIQTLHQRVEDAGKAYELADQAHEAAKQNVTDLTTEMEPAEQKALDAKAKFQEVKGRLVVLLADERIAQGEVKEREKNVHKLEAEIAQYRQRQAEADNGRHAEKIRERDDAKVKYETARLAFEGHDTGLAALQDQLATAQKEQNEADRKVEDAQKEVSRIRESIARMQRGQSNWDDGYQNRQRLSELLRAIESEHRFREKPVGPMGRHVKLRLQDWGGILEKQFGQTLNAFVVTSKPDQNILSALMKRVGWCAPSFCLINNANDVRSAPIYIGKRTPINTDGNEPAENLTTWMKALTFDDDLVRNQLIINQSIEQTVLIENMDEGAQFMFNRGPPTTNVKMCFTFADGDTTKGRVFVYNSGGGINNSPIAPYTGALRMQVDKDTRIQLEEKNLAQAKGQLETLQQQSRERHDEVNKCKAQLQDHERQKKHLRLASQTASKELERLEFELEKATPDEAAIQVRESELAEAQEELKNVMNVYEDAVTQRIGLNDENRANKQEMEAAQKLVADLRSRLDKAHVTVRTLQGTRQEELQKKNEAIEQVAEAEKVKKNWQEELLESQQSLAEVTEGATSICERVFVPPNSTSDDLQRRMVQMAKTREEAERELGGSQLDLTRAATEAKQKHHDAMKEFEDIRSLRNQLITTLDNRRNRWKQFRSGISVRARVTFNYLLSERKFRGTLSIDHKKALLDIHVQPDIMERSGDGRQTKTLSGGEKSYSTVCLLLSLWDAMGSPIRCLDEFDVFMDSVNRERSMHMIIQAARRSIGRQFIFITPQSMSNVTQTSDVKIIKMTDPERGQTALNVQRS